MDNIIANISNGTEDNKTHHAVVADHRSENLVLILFVCGSCAIGAAVRQLVCVIKPKLPYTVVLLLLGVALGVGSRSVPGLERYLTSHISDADPHIILFVFLPVLIFESAFAMEYHTFKKSFFQVIILALPGLAIAALLTAVLAVQMFNYEWDWIIGMMFGSILSATDPVAVVAILRETGASKKLAMVTEGESLFNDGAAIVLFNVFFDLAIKSGGASAEEIFANFMRVAVGGPAFGFLMAEITIYWLSNIFNDTIGEITITLSSTYLTFYIAEEFCKISGVLAVVILGITIGSKKTCISPEVETFLHRFWEMLAYLANTLIFILVGVVISDRALFKVHGIDWFYLIALYFGINVIRGLVIALLSPILIRIGYGMPWRDAIVMTWGGLRGAVGLALALMVVESPHLDLERVRIKIFIHVCGIVFLTLMINATTISYLLKVLGMSDISQAKRMAMDSALRFMEEQQQKTLNVLKTDRFLADADWDQVAKTCEIGHPYHKSKEEVIPTSMTLDIRPDLTCPECECSLPAQPTKKELLEMTNEAILRILKAEKLSYWRQFEQGMLSRDALQKLDECTEVATDQPGTFIDLEEVKSSWDVSKVLLKLKHVLKTGCRKRPIKVKPPKELNTLFKFTVRKEVYVFIYAVILLDCINSTVSIVAEYVPLIGQEKMTLHIINAVYVTVYITEVVLKLITQQRTYFEIAWQILSLIIAIHGFLDVILQFVLATYNDGNHDSVKAAVLILIVSRSIRLLRLLEPMMPWMLLMVKRRIMMHLSYGFDLGRGFVTGEEEVRKLIDHLIENKDIARQLKNRCEKNRLEVIRCLGLLQKQHPDIALAVKTRQATRSVLNSLRDSAKMLCEEGILEDSEADKLQQMVEVKMKHLLNAPHSITPPTVDNVLRCAAWLQNDPDVIKFMKARAQMVNYNFGETIMSQGEPSDGICTLVFGLVRVEVTTPEQENKLVDFLTTGSIIGEMGLLTKKPRVASVRCETNVQMLFISNEDMEEAMARFDHLEPPLTFRLWKVCGVRLATGILMAQPEYHGLSIDKVRIHLENAYIEEVLDKFSTNNTMTDVMLINGSLEDTFNGHVYDAPVYIPSSVQKLRPIFQEDTPAPILLIVPNAAFHASAARRGSPGISSPSRRGSHRPSIFDVHHKKLLPHLPDHSRININEEDEEEADTTMQGKRSLFGHSHDHGTEQVFEIVTEPEINVQVDQTDQGPGQQPDTNNSNAAFYPRDVNNSSSGPTALRGSDVGRCLRHRTSMPQDHVTPPPTIYHSVSETTLNRESSPSSGDFRLQAQGRAAGLQQASRTDGTEVKNRKSASKSEKHKKSKSKSMLVKFLLPPNKVHCKKTKAVSDGAGGSEETHDEVELISVVQDPAAAKSGEENSSYVESSHM